MRKAAWLCACEAAKTTTCELVQGEREGADRRGTESEEGEEKVPQGAIFHVDGM